MHYRAISLTCLFCLLAQCHVLPCRGQTALPAAGNQPLIDVADLQGLLQQPDSGLVLLDMGPEREVYDQAHLPGAVFVDWVDDITDLSQPDRYKLIDKTAMESLLGRLGVTDQSRIVIYDDMDNRVSVRMYWSLKYYGIPRVQVLDGGKQAWLSAGLETSGQPPRVTSTNFRINTVNEKMSVNLDFIADRLQDPHVALVDGRPASQFSGEQPGKVFHTGALHNKRGHIPGAINIFWKDNFRADGTFKSRPELEKLYESVTGSDLVVTYCNEGLHAVPAWFVLSELLGHGDVRVYDDSLSEWANTEQPVECIQNKQ